MLASMKPAVRTSTASTVPTGIRSSRFVVVRCQQGGEQLAAARTRAAVAIPAAVAAAAPLLLACGAAVAAPEVVGDLAGLDANTAGLLRTAGGPIVNLITVLMIVRIVMTWYPEIDGNQLPWSIAYKPTEGVLSATRKVVPPLAGVDVSPIVWVGILSFFSEIILGPQGILSLIQRQGGI